MAEIWTAEQHAAITETRHLLLAANAGTGKTATVVGKILWRLGLPVPEASDGPVSPCEDPCDLGRIAAITFTEKAAQDLRRKLREALSKAGVGPGELDRAFVGTIHGFCGEILRQHALRLDIDPSFAVMDAREASLRLGELVRETVLDAVEAGERDIIELLKDAPLDRYDPQGSSVTDFVRGAMRDLRWHRSRYEDWFEAPSGPEPLDRQLDLPLLKSLLPEGGSDSPARVAAEARYLRHTAAVYRLGYRSLGRWLSLLERENRRDFDSLVLDVRRLLTHERFGPALDALRSRFRLLVVDEFQDTDTAQRDIVFAIGGLTPESRPEVRPQTQLFLVGDPKQSIYAFRGADVRVWNRVEERFRDVGAVRRLGWNFRCDPSLVDLVNRSCEPAFDASGTALAEADASAVVSYDSLDPAVEAWSGAGVDWLAVDGGGTSADRLRGGAALVADRIDALLKPASDCRVRGSDGRERPVRPDDIAVLGMRRKTLEAVERALRDRGVRTYNAASRGLAERQEVLDAITALRLADNPRDDLHAFAFLRSPFVGLRDEVIARIRLDPALPAGSLVQRATAWLNALDEGDLTPFEAPENSWVEPTERFALGRGLRALREAHELVGRADPAEVLETLLARTAYRIHLRFRDGCDESLANLERLKAVLGEYRALSLADFLTQWDRASGDREADLAVAPVSAGVEGSVLLTTIHSAKGLEWPIVVLAGAEDGGARPTLARWTGWTDRELGPVLLPRSAERGARSTRAEEKRRLEEEAEATRLMYVALTRARDRLMIVAPTDAPKGHAGWIGKALFAERESPVGDKGTAASAQSDSRVPGRGPAAELDDPSTGTGRQLDAFGLHEPAEDDQGQLNLLNPTNHGPELEQESRSPGGRLRAAAKVWRVVGPIQQEFAPAPVCLDWLDGIQQAAAPEAIGPLPESAAGHLRSATELDLEQRDPEAWRRRYVHGVLSASRFAGESDRGRRTGASVAAEEAIPGRVRGLIVHDVLERSGAEGDPDGPGLDETTVADSEFALDELDRLLDQAIGGLREEDSALLVGRTEAGELTRLREEIHRVLSGEAWREWMASEHYRELPFVHLAGPGDWRQGRIDLFVPRPQPSESGHADVRIVDFKTDRVQGGGVEAAARRYATQARVYREAIEAILGASDGVLPGGGRVRVVLHFTGPDRQVEV
jgi:ATP-dependent exoDNAse (exonuclease V) beta subunit